MSQKERVHIEILGEKFTVKGDSTKEEIEKAGNHLTGELRRLKTRFSTMSDKNLLILTAFNLTEEFLRLKKDYEELASMLDKTELGVNPRRDEKKRG